jgi:tetratricopeptide (TPR) repeat protein
VALATALSVEARCCETRTQTSKTLAAVNEALACWERVALNAHAHWGHDAQVAECLLLRGQCEQVNGELTAAAKTTAEAIELLDDLLEREPSNVTFKERLAIGRQTLGVIHSHLSEFSFAEQEYQQSLNQFNQLAIQHPGVPAYQGRAAGVRYSLGFLQYSTGQFESALKTLSRNVSITKSLAERYPQMNSQFLQSCATNQQLLYGVYDKLDRNGEARESLEASIETYQAILDKIPDNNFVVTQLGNSYVMLGKSLLVSENHDASHQAIEVAIGRLRNALEMAPDYARAKVYLADAYDCQIAIFDHQGDWPQAIKASTSFVEFAQTPDQMLKAAACRVNVFVQSGKIEQAILTFHTTKFDAENASSLGCYLATREFADSIARIEANESLSPTEIQFVESLVQTATRWLEHASKLGHFKNSGVIAAESDEALAALLKHPAYQKRLVTE